MVPHIGELERVGYERGLQRKKTRIALHGENPRVKGKRGAELVFA